MNEKLRNIFEGQLKKDIESLNEKILPKIQKRLKEMREYAISRHDYYESCRRQYMNLGVAVIGFSIVFSTFIYSFIENGDISISILTKILILGGLAILFLTGLILIFHFVINTSPDYPYRRLANIKSWFYIYNISDKFRNRTKCLSEEERENIAEEIGKDFLSYSKKWIEWCKEDRRFILEDLEQVYILFILQHYKRFYTKRMAQIFKLGILFSIIFLFAGFIILVIN